MKPRMIALLALALSAPQAAAAQVYRWDARYVGQAADYGFEFDDQGISWKNGPIGRGCVERDRGLILKVTEPVGGGFAQIFPDPNRKRAPIFADVLIDVRELKSEGARAAVELDSPFVPIGGQFDAFVILTVERLQDGSFVAFTSIPGQNVGTPLVLPAGTPGVVAQLSYENGLVDVSAAACDTGAALTSMLVDQALAFGGNSGLGVGITGEKGDRAGFSFAISGDLFDLATQDVLEDLGAAIDLENAALTDLMNGRT